jgi:uncharacterized protein with HEPN domain
MPSEAAATRRVLTDIAYHLDLIEAFVQGFDYPRFAEDVRTLYAVIRCLEIVSEASRRLPDALKQRHPQIAWRAMAGAGNVYRHDYEDVAARFVWETVQTAIPPLRAVVRQELMSDD